MRRYYVSARDDDDDDDVNMSSKPHPSTWRVAGVEQLEGECAGLEIERLSSDAERNSPSDAQCIHSSSPVLEEDGMKARTEW